MSKNDPLAKITEAQAAVKAAETPADRKEARAKRDELILAHATSEEQIAPTAEAAGVTTARIREITGIRKGRRKAAVAQPDEAQNPEGAETVEVEEPELTEADAQV